MGHYLHYFPANYGRKNPISDLVGYLLQPVSIKRCCTTAREGCNLSRAVDDVKFWLLLVASRCFALLRVQSKRTFKREMRL